MQEKREEKQRVFAFMPMGVGPNGERYVRIGVRRVSGPVGTGHHGLNKPRLMLLNMLCEDANKKVGQLVGMLRGHLEYAPGQRFSREVQFNEERAALLGYQWFHVQLDDGELKKLFELIKASLQPRREVPSLEQQYIERLQGASKPKPNQLSTGGSLPREVAVRELPGGDVLISRCSSALAALIVCSPEVK